MKKKIVVCGGGGFIGGHLVDDLLKKGHRDIRAVDIQKLLGWEPNVRVRDGMEKTYAWIYDEIASGKAHVANAPLAGARA